MAKPKPVPSYFRAKPVSKLLKGFKQAMSLLRFQTNAGVSDADDDLAPLPVGFDLDLSMIPELDGVVDQVINTCSTRRLSLTKLPISGSNRTKMVQSLFFPPWD